MSMRWSTRCHDSRCGPCTTHGTESCTSSPTCPLQLCRSHAASSNSLNSHGSGRQNRGCYSKVILVHGCISLLSRNLILLRAQRSINGSVSKCLTSAHRRSSNQCSPNTSEHSTRRAFLGWWWRRMCRMNGRGVRNNCRWWCSSRRQRRPWRMNRSFRHYSLWNRRLCHWSRWVGSWSWRYRVGNSWLRYRRCMCRGWVRRRRALVNH
mmetsp:Transcript_21773/g.45758  ORF Transcript_21773/g.45758 Transcript_21773/m.45758 type:complete len:208 (+) Transcript_21773:287-910(+)